jgi:hypothetical protein
MAALYTVFSIDIGICNLGWSVFELVKSDDRSIASVRFLDGGVDQIMETAKHKSTAVIVKKFTKWMREGPLSKYPLAHVVCELQLGRAIKNKILAMILLSYWHPRPFDFVSSNKKFTDMPSAFFPKSVDQTTITHQVYKVRKNASVLLGLHICTFNTSFRPAELMFKSLKKKDDFGDAFCQGIYFITKPDKPPTKKRKRQQPENKKTRKIVDEEEDTLTESSSSSSNE